MRVTLIALMTVLGLAGFASVAYGLERDDKPLGYHAYVLGIAAGDAAPPAPTPTPTSIPTPVPRPPVYDGKVASLYLASGGVSTGSPIQELDTHYVGGRELFQDPYPPRFIATYPRFGKPGYAGLNTIFAAHVDYFDGSAVPFSRIGRTQIGDALYVTMDNGLEYAYTVKSVQIIPVSELNMDEVVYPALDSYTERVTLISCTGDLIQSAVGAEYTSRLIVAAERYVP